MGWGVGGRGQERVANSYTESLSPAVAGPATSFWGALFKTTKNFKMARADLKPVLDPHKYGPFGSPIQPVLASRLFAWLSARK